MDVKFSITLPRAPYTVGVTRQFIRAVLDSNGVDGDFRDDILAATAEACANVIDHGYPARVYQVQVRIREDCCVIEISDSGTFFDVEQLPSPGVDSESGRGILMMRELMDSVTLQPTPSGGTHVALCKWRQPLSVAPPRRPLPATR